MQRNPSTTGVIPLNATIAAIALLSGALGACGGAKEPAEPPQPPAQTRAFTATSQAEDESSSAQPRPLVPHAAPQAPGAQALAATPQMSAESPATRCLAIATAQRERRPDEPAKITVKHILIKYAGEGRADPSITRSRESACLRAMEARDKLRGGADFDKIVKEYSEDQGTSGRGGTVAGVERRMLVPSFADAAFVLDISQLSDVVETQYGFHVILRTE
jgi:parvulin-like peptidyl-prolyl isomerase